jgi:hypothetical protein
MQAPQDRTEQPIAPEGAEIYGDSDSESEDEAGGGAFQAILDDVLHSDNPFNDEEDEEDNMGPNDETGDKHQNNKNPTVCALKYLAARGLTLAELLENVVFGDTII